ncbi:hypothetical protein ADK64_15275 [Streptomyces sp. MMG1121]|nr:hypothetical protein ADK64_15275 [Streptomyces sp. MMG1121]
MSAMVPVEAPGGVPARPVRTGEGVGPVAAEEARAVSTVWASARLTEKRAPPMARPVPETVAVVEPTVSSGEFRGRRIFASVTT